MWWQLGGPSVPARSPKHLHKIPLGLCVEPWERWEARWGCWGGAPPPCSGAQGIRAGLRLLSAHLMPRQITRHLQSMRAPVLGPSPGHTCSHLWVVLVPSCPTCLLFPLIPSPKACPCLLIPLVLVPWSHWSLLLVQLVSISWSHLNPGPFWFHLSPSPGPICSIFWLHFPPLLILLVPNSWSHWSPLLVKLVPSSWSHLFPSPGTICPLSFSHSSPSPCPTWALSLSHLSPPLALPSGQLWCRPSRIQHRLLGPEPFPTGGSPTQPPKPHDRMPWQA